MCEPLAIASIGLAAGGALMSGISQNQQASAVNKVRSEADSSYAAKITQERARQQQLQQQETDIYNKDLDKMSRSNQDAQKDTIAQNLSGKYSDASKVNTDAANIPGLSTNLEGGSSAMKVISGDAGKQLGKISDFLNQQAGAKANIDAFGTSMLNNGIEQNRGTQDIGLLTNFARGSKNTLDTELGYENLIASKKLQNAQGKGGTLSTIGSVAGGLGNALSRGATWGAS